MHIQYVLIIVPLSGVLITCGDKRVASLCEDLHQVVSQVSASQVQPHDGMGQSITLIYGHIVGHTITSIQHNTYRQRGGLQWVCQLGFILDTTEIHWTSWTFIPYVLLAFNRNSAIMKSNHW